MTVISITRDVASFKADWDVLYAAYADYYKVEQNQEMRDRTWGWIMEGPDQLPDGAERRREARRLRPYP